MQKNKKTMIKTPWDEKTFEKYGPGLNVTFGWLRELELKKVLGHEDYNEMKVFLEGIFV